MEASQKAMNFILKKLKKKKKDRSATFVCSLTYKYPMKKSVTVVGKIKGKISKKKSGKNGFGYDPIFLPNNQKITFGQMSKSKKMQVDHRFVAFTKLKQKINI